MLGDVTEGVSVVQVFRAIGSLPRDLLATGIFSVLAEVVFTVPWLAATPIRPLVGLPLLLFVPGYTLVSAAFPGNGKVRHPVLGTGHARGSSPDLVERFALAFAMSIVLLPPIAILAWTLGVGIAASPVIVAGVGIVGSVVAGLQRYRLPPRDRFHLPVHRWSEQFQASLDRDGSRSYLFNAVLAVSVLFAATTVGYALVVPNEGEAYSSLYLGTEAEDGTLVTSGYPSELVSGEPAELLVGIENHEPTRTTYTVVTELRAVSNGEEQELDRFQVTLAPGETLEQPRVIAPDLVGEKLKLQYYLYPGEAPADATTDSAYRTAYIWVTVTEDDG
jgi:uncharacterized membrane protein